MADLGTLFAFQSEGLFFSVHISKILVREHNHLAYVFRDGHTQEVQWQNPSRRESWTEEMKQKARKRQLEIVERRRKNGGTC